MADPMTPEARSALLTETPCGLDPDDSRFRKHEPSLAWPYRCKCGWQWLKSPEVGVKILEKEVLRLSAKLAELETAGTFADGYSAGGEQMRRDMEQAQAWQPIETAPKDGTRLLLWWRAEFGPDVFDVWASGSWHQFGSNDAGWSGETFYSTLEGGFWSRLIGERPTHWMPLPAPPHGPPAQRGEQ